MSKFKKMSVFLIMLVLTLVVIFLPQLFFGQGEGNLSNRGNYRTYNGGSREKVTAKQVAKLYSNRQIRLEKYNYVSENALVSEVSESSLEGAEELLETFFGSDEVFCEHLKSILFDENAICFRRSVLIKLDNRPIALNFVDIGTKIEGGVVDILYEEKTGTLIKFSYELLQPRNSSIAKMTMSPDELETRVNDYFEKQLELENTENYLILEINETRNQQTDEPVISGYIEFGIKQMLQEKEIY